MVTKTPNCKEPRFLDTQPPLNRLTSPELASRVMGHF